MDLVDLVVECLVLVHRLVPVLCLLLRPLLFVDFGVPVSSSSSSSSALAA